MELEPSARARLHTYLDGVGSLLGDPRRRQSFALYVAGLFSMLTRKTCEGIATLQCEHADEMDALHQRLLHFLGQSTWNDDEVRRFATRYALDAMLAGGSVKAWVIDDTGWLKQGKHSVGVQRQYTGSAGKVTNCQVGVSLTVTTATTQLASDFALYLPQSWTEDENRRRSAKIPADTEFKSKPALALELLDKAIADEVPLPEIFLADAGYGNSAHFRAEVRRRNLHYGVGINATTSMWRVDASGSCRGPRTTADRIGQRLKFRKVSWHDDYDGKMSARFAFCRVRPARDYDNSVEPADVWLVVEWPNTDDKPSKYHLCSLPRGTSKTRIVGLLHQRWRTEKAYRDLKQEFGLDHYEGRSFIGWHHHITAALVCNAFAVAEQARLFPPPRQITQNGSLSIAA